MANREQEGGRGAGGGTWADVASSSVSVSRGDASWRFRTSPPFAAAPSIPLGGLFRSSLSRSHAVVPPSMEGALGRDRRASCLPADSRRVMLFMVSFILVPGHLCRGADLGRRLATAALGGFRPYLPCGGPRQFGRLAASLDVGLSDSMRLASTCAADATLVAACGVSQLAAWVVAGSWGGRGRRRSMALHGRALPEA